MSVGGHGRASMLAWEWPSGLTEFLDLSVKEEMASRPGPVWELWEKLAPWLPGSLLTMASCFPCFLGSIPLATFWPSGAICTKLMPPSHTLGSKLLSQATGVLSGHPYQEDLPPPPQSL